MAAFNELIKNYDKIREYMRDFLVYGYKSRSDFDKKSLRSYDNERRRIENYLSDYIDYENKREGKCLYISSGSIDTEDNPLFKSWQSKSFTKNDVLLHFVILDILRDDLWLSVSEILEIIDEDYLSRLENPRLPDQMTVRNKLKEYVNLGLIDEKTEGKKVLYGLKSFDISFEDPKINEVLYSAIKYYQNILPAGILGYSILDYLKTEETRETYSFRHQYFAQTLDDEIAYQLFKAIGEKHSVVLSIATRIDVRRVKTVPLVLINNIYTGRRYVAAYNLSIKQYETHRLDKIVEVKPGEPAIEFDQKLHMVQYKLNNAWGVAIQADKPLETISVTFRIEKQETFILDRIKREGRHGSVRAIGDNRYLYEIKVTDAWEAIPWFRTFIGRIETFDCSNEFLVKYFWQDFQDLSSLYSEVE